MRMYSKRKRILIGVLIGLYVLTISFNVGNIIWNSDWKNGAGDIVVVDSYAYIAGYERGLIIIDVSNPSALVRVGHLDTSGSANGIAIADSYAYITDHDAGLVIVDISNPSNPVLVNRMDTLGSVFGIDVVDSYAYVISEHKGFIVLDVSTPSIPVLVNRTDILLFPRGIMVVDSFAYIVDIYEGLLIVDISTPSAPVLVDRTEIPAAYVHNIAVIGSYAYITSAYSGLIIFDISTPSAPVIVGQVNPLGYFYDIVVIDTYAYITDLNGRIIVIDISIPSEPDIINQAETPGEAHDIAIVGSYAYITGRDNGLLVFEINTSSEPARVLNYFYNDSISILILIIANIPTLWISIVLMTRIIKKRQKKTTDTFEDWFTRNMNLSPILFLSAYRSEKSLHKFNEKFLIKQLAFLGIKYKCSGIWHPSLKGYVFLSYFDKNLTDMVNQQGKITIIQWATQLNMLPEDAMIILKTLLRNETIPIEFNPQTLVISHRTKIPMKS